MNELRTNPFFDEDKVDEVISLVNTINGKLDKETIVVEADEEDGSTLDVFFNDRTIYSYTNIDEVVSLLHGIELAMKNKEIFLALGKSYVHIVQLNDTTDEEGTNSEIIGVFYDKEKAQELLAEKKAEIAKMYEGKIPNPSNNVKVGCDKPCRYHIYDEYSDNDTEVFIEKQEIK